MTRRRSLRPLVALCCGVLFGLGLSLSGMLDPSRVLGFLDIASGHWDPSLMLVFVGALSIAIPGVLLQRRLDRPALDTTFHIPGKTRIDRRLVLGSAIFGMGWGLGGYCPGPAIAGLATGTVATMVFVLAMVIGMLVHDRFMAGKAQ